MPKSQTLPGHSPRTREQMAGPTLLAGYFVPASTLLPLSATLSVGQGCATCFFLQPSLALR